MVYKKICKIAGRLPIGLAGKLFFVVYMEREDMPHIISVRLAEPDEKKLYYENREFLPEGWYRVNSPGTGND
jgi:hypothetical protein